LERELVVVDLATLQHTLADQRLQTKLWAIWLVNSPLFSLLERGTPLDLRSKDVVRPGLADAGFRLLGVLALERGRNPSNTDPGELAGWLMVMDGSTGKRLCQTYVSATGPPPVKGETTRTALATAFQRTAQASLRRISATLTILTELPQN